MKISIICPNYPPATLEGGISHYTQKLVHHMQTMVDEFIIIAGDHYLGEKKKGNISVMKFSGKWNRGTICQIISELKSRNIDLVNLQYSPSIYPLSFKLAWLYRKEYLPSIVSFHTLWGGSKVHYLVAFGLLQSSDAGIATNSEILYLTKKYLPFYQKKLRFIPIGSNIEPINKPGNSQEISSKYPINKKDHVIAYFGMTYPGKGMNLLFNAMGILKDRHNLEFKLLLIGGGIFDSPEYIYESQRLISKLGIEDRVIWTGKISDAEVSSLLLRSEMVILPFDSGVSDRRGSLMAALAHKKAIVTTKPSIPIALFKNGVNMVWSENGDKNDISEITLRVLQDNKLRKKLEKGAAELSSHFTWSQIAKQTHKCFREITEKPFNINKP